MNSAHPMVQHVARVNWPGMGGHRCGAVKPDRCRVAGVLCGGSDVLDRVAQPDHAAIERIAADQA